MDNQQVAKHIAELKDMDEAVRQNAAEALIEIGTPAVLALIEAWENANRTEWSLTLKYATPDWDGPRPEEVRARDMLEEISAGYVKEKVTKVLGTDTLPRKIIEDSRFSAQERINVLERLRRHVHYGFPETSALCQMVLNEEDAEARAGAQQVLNWLDSKELLRPSKRDTDAERKELVRASQGGLPEAQPDTLLRANDAPKEDVKPHPTRPMFWQRLFGKREEASS